MNISFEAQKTLKRIIAELNLSHLKPKQKSDFLTRIEQGFEPLFTQLFPLYGERYDLHFHLATLFQAFADFSTKRRPAKIKDSDPNWIKSNKNVGIAVYVDQIADDLSSLIDKVPYFKELGVNYVHLMPLYLAPEGNSDGGYAISDYRTVSPNLGTNKDLKELAAALHKNGIRMVLDFVFNHTSDEHEWALEAKKGNLEYQDYYYFMSGQEANEFNQTVREIFPQVRRGSFTYMPEMDQHVWTTFNSFQWDLNYKNPAVFVAVVEEMLHLILNGCDVLRLDALAFVWKEKWTVCENLTKAHNLIKAFKACLDIAAPEVVFKSEAIVHPDEVNKYIGSDECTLSYNPLVMALLWESLATRKTPLLYSSMERSFTIPNDTAWINYIRCHDDIGWLWDDEVSGRLGINGYDHRLFLNQFYTGQFEGSFAAGVPFQANPTTGDCRVCGTLASLVGVESAINSGNELLLEHALRRIKLLNGINFALPGIPLLYQGDDLGVLNDDTYLQDPDKKEDSRWVQRKKLTESDFTMALDASTPQGKIAQLVRGMIKVRQENTIFAADEFELIHLNSEHLFGFIRKTDDQRLLTIANFSEHPIFLDGPLSRYLHCNQAKDLITNEVVDLPNLNIIEPLAVHWFIN
ncbi:amylosucrase [Marinomonas mediterranea]|jgi:Glycosidases|uniref:Amylosucrase n=1 Tax=Marinomonas mediterranea (strain ATCC 700492 / JCM 21426 / NBRC 103028 / MMB-1) TaxID=717774 RepID=F2K341_MARM1|nr:amylosucrase [Marinomonas mediterranea]ADZ90094.1 Amylosucrase [Marinomonas mediterranea MMB-1]WCN08158.1 amylosucrase [Marinomonas mediterranea]WCN16299.1 amylosucrase [Marinomonas mediterranea MMB-1]